MQAWWTCVLLERTARPRPGVVQAAAGRGGGRVGVEQLAPLRAFLFSRSVRARAAERLPLHGA